MVTEYRSGGAGLLIPTPGMEVMRALAGEGLPPTPFYEAIVGHWPLDEPSGLPANSIAGNPTFDTMIGTPGSVVGKLGTGRIFNGSNYFSSSNAVFYNLDAATEDWSYSYWFDAPATGTHAAMGLGQVTGNRAWGSLHVSGSLWTAGYQSSPAAAIFTSTPGVYSTNTWHFAAGKYDHTARRVYVSINGSAWQQSAAFAAGVNFTQGVLPFLLGAMNADLRFTGSLDEAAFWRGYALTDADRDFLYGAGAGRTWSEIQVYGNAP